MELLVYGDFNCPYSALASYRASWLESTGVARVTWRAVQHDPAIPATGEPLSATLARDLQREVAEVRSLLAPGEVFPMLVPPRRSNTALASARFAGSPAGRAQRRLRRQIFRALWLRGQDISQPDLVGDVVWPSADPAVAADWQRGFDALERPMTPSLVLPDGYVSRGLGALRRLQDLVATA